MLYNRPSPNVFFSDESMRTSTMEKNLINKRKQFHQQSNKVFIMLESSFAFQTFMFICVMVKNAWQF